MNGKKKRRPDGRKIRETKTYTVAELAAITQKSPQTIYDWIDEGLPTIDDLSPIMIFGHVAKAWLDEKWGRRKHKLSMGYLYCPGSGCQQARPPLPKTIRFLKRLDGAIHANGNCCVCGTRMNRGIKAEDIAAFQDAVAVLPVDVERFKDSYTTFTNPDAGADSHTLPDSTRKPVEKRRQRAALLPCNPGNERLKHAFFEFRHEASDGRSPLSIRADETALLRYESYFDFRDFGKLSKDEAIAFKNDLRASGLTLPVVVATLAAIIVFLKWLSDRDGYRRKISLKNADYLRVTRNERRSARSSETIKASPTPEQVDLAIMTMSAVTLIEMRNQAIMALHGTTAMRAAAIASLRLKHVDTDEGVIHQRGQEMKTKFGKNIESVIIPIKPGWIRMLKDYKARLLSLGFTGEDPFFPKLEARNGPGVTFGERYLSKHFLSDAQMIGQIVKSAFAAIGLKFGPHSFRHMQWAIAQDAPPRIALAISLNLGHSSTKVSFEHYGKKTLEERRSLLQGYFQENDVEKQKEIEKALENLTKLIGRSDRRD